tara:strand:+ start:1158 stop:1430 length:273 start_codon:yes stop_codon:yes gene_type:complete
MISYKEFRLYEKLKKKNSHEQNIKYKHNGSLDMRYSSSIKLFGKEYKKLMIQENRKYNNVCNFPHESYRQEILKMTESELVEYFCKDLKN